MSNETTMCDEVALDFEIDGEIYVVDTPEYGGSYVITPSVSAQTIGTAEKKLVANLTINPIPLVEVDNESGVTAVIGGVE